jgi:glycosyltransferase involved in cell wall biosynthesis
MSNANNPHVVFIHLDLGIGGAESLVLNLAKATLHPNHERRHRRRRDHSGDERSSIQSHADLGGDDDDDVIGNGTFGYVSIYTTHCSPSHCYEEVRPPTGHLSSCVRVRGSWMPRELRLVGGGTALCSALRMLYLTWKARRENPNADVFVIDVLPTGVPYLTEWCNVCAGVLFYCHFPDKLLTRATINGENAVDYDGGGGKGRSMLMNILYRLRRMYRWAMDSVEEWSMSYSDLIVVNSNFTRGEVRRVLPSLFPSPEELDGTNEDLVGRNCEKVKVLYPSIESSLAKQRRISSGIKSNDEVEVDNNVKYEESFTGPIVSLNRFERKKNVALLLRAYDLLIKRATKEGGTAIYELPPLIIAGGYDPINVENVEHLAELRGLADEILARYHLPRSTVCPPSKVSAAVDDMLGGIARGPSVAFLPSISNARRTQLLSTASVWCYTPHREHFGIVPLEAMDAGVPVVAINSGGPMETIIDGMTGYLVDYSPDNAGGENPTVRGFANSIHKLLSDRCQSRIMGQRGRERVDETFGSETFRRQWWELLRETQSSGMRRHNKGFTSYPSLGWSTVRALGDLFCVVLLVLLITWTWNISKSFATSTREIES